MELIDKAKNGGIKSVSGILHQGKLSTRQKNACRQTGQPYSNSSSSGSKVTTAYLRDRRCWLEMLIAHQGDVLRENIAVLGIGAEQQHRVSIEQ